MTTPIYLDPSFAQSFTMYGADTVPYQTLIWQRFLAQYEATYGETIDTSKPLSDAIKSEYDDFYNKYAAWDLGSQALSSEIDLFDPNDSRYSNCMLLVSQLFPGMTLVQLKDIWSAFVRSAGYWNTPATTIDLSGPFAEYLKNLYTKQQSFDETSAIEPTDPSKILQNNLWNRFLSIYSIEDTYHTSSSKALQDEFKKFLQRYNQYNITNEVLLSKNTLPSASNPDGSAILNYLNSFYGDLSTQEKTDIWNSFLSRQGYTTNPTTLASLKDSFVDYINSLRKLQQEAERTTGLSPNTILSRAILDSVFPSLRSMMTQSEQVVSNYAQAIMHYGKIQENYTQMMANVPTITPVSDITSSTQTTLQVPSGDISTWDLSKVTFGYANISLGEVISWAVTNLMDPALPLGKTLNFTPVSSNGVSYVGTYGFTLVEDADGTKKIEISYENPYSGAHISKKTAVVVTKDSLGFPLSTDDMINSTTLAYKNLLQTISQENTAFLPFLQSHPQALTGRFLSSEIKTVTDKDGNPIVDTGELDKRAEQNAVLGQYIESIRSQRDKINARLQQLQGVLTASRDAINSISDLWTSILETINNIMHSIFSHSA